MMDWLKELFSGTAHAPSWLTFVGLVGLGTAGAKAIYGTPWDNDLGRPTRKEVKKYFDECHERRENQTRQQIQTINDMMAVNHKFQEEFRDEFRGRFDRLESRLDSHVERHP